LTPNDIAVEEIARRVVQLLADRRPGHCIRISDLPLELADGACEQAAGSVEPPDVVCLVTTEPSRPWHARPTKVVELRNASEQDDKAGRLAIFVPAGQRVAAEDSFGRTTFEVVSFTDIYRRVAERLLSEIERLEPDLAEVAREVIEVVREDPRSDLTDRAVADYLAAIATEPVADSIGTALPRLGLIPDRGLASLSAHDRGRRLLLNLRQLDILTELSPPAERVRKVPLDQTNRQDKEILRSVLDAVSDGSVDRFEIGRRLGDPRRRETVDFGKWRLELVSVLIEELSVTKLIGDFDNSTEPVVNKANASIGVQLRCRPAPASIVGLEELRLEVLRLGSSVDELIETGNDVVKKKRSLPRTMTPQWRMRVAIGDREGGLEEGLYRFQLRAMSAEGFELKRDLSEVFRVGPVGDEEPPAEVIPSIEAAMAAARSLGASRHTFSSPVITLGAPHGPSVRKVIVASLRFEGVSRVWELRIPSLLARLEAWTIADPDSLGRYALTLDSNEIQGPISSEVEIDESFMSIRRSLFKQLTATQFNARGDVEFGPSVVLSDLETLGPLIASYVESWKRALDEARDDATRAALLSIDQAVLTGDRQVPELRMLIPTHPLRIGWLARYRQVVNQWLQGASTLSEEDARELNGLLRQLPAPNLPLVVAASRHPMRHLDSLDFVWSFWGPANVADVEALADRLRRWLGLGPAAAGPVRVDELVERVRRYLRSHPYVERLTLNFVQPGAASLVLGLLLEMQQDKTTSDLRYVVRLFSSEADLGDLGRSLDEFMTDPDAARAANRDAADTFLGAGEDTLAPKLTYSKHTTDALLRMPEAFPAHLTFFLDWFALRIVAAPLMANGRSEFAGGLVLDSAIVYRPGDDQASPQWDEQVIVRSSEDTLLSCYASCQDATARVIGSDAPNQVPTVRLDLDRVSRTILDAVHRVSDWVVIIDPVFTDSFLDEPGRENEIRRYLIDYVPPSLIGGSRHILVSSRLRDEISTLFRPAAARYGLEIGESAEELLLEALQFLGSGLPLRLLHDRNRAVEAISLALASLYLADKGVLRHAIAMPLDLHQDLFRELRYGASSSPGLQRTDLAVIQIDAERRHFGLHLVEVKARSSLPVPLPTELVEHISEQLDNSLEVLRDRLFAANLADRRASLSAALHVRRLTHIMLRYVERAVRFGYLEGSLAGQLQAFIATLDRSYTIAFRKHALVFELGGDGGPNVSAGDVDIVRIGRAEITALLDRSATPLATRYAQSRPERIETALGGRAEAGVAVVVEPVDTPVATPPPTGTSQVEPPTELPGGPGTRDEGPSLDDVVLLGMVAAPRQYGIVASLDTGEKVAVDTDGTNVVSVFGVQGSGKSYTVGTIIEAALLQDPHLNRLPNPLGVVVFHYSTDQSYAPEYASMSYPNDDAAAVTELAAVYGALPSGLADVALLVPDALQAQRRLEFPRLPVHSLMLAPQELTLNDWKLLMGIEGSDQMYSKAMTAILRRSRASITLATMRAEITASSMSAAQKNIALTRLSFMEGFVSDDGGVSHLLVPGRLLIVDLRDELVEQDEALALFMVLLGRFAQVQTADGRNFNKLIVFDEAHKYMGDPRLTTAIVSTIREMRHRGTSVVIASQNPPSVPREVIELSQIVFAHAFSSPTWLDHIKKVQTSFSELVPSNLARLRAGQAYVWAAGNERFRKPQRVIVRPRATRHGGATRRATE
jgi:hypothetical protein